MVLLCSIVILALWESPSVVIPSLFHFWSQLLGNGQGFVTPCWAGLICLSCLADEDGINGKGSCVLCLKTNWWTRYRRFLLDCIHCMKHRCHNGGRKLPFDCFGKPLHSLNMKTTKWCGFETLWFGQHCMHLVEVNQNWLKMFSPICWDLTSVKPNSHRVPHVWFWVSQYQPPTLHTKIAILYKAKLGRWSSLYCTLPSQLKEIGHPTPILRIIVIEEFCNLFEYFLPLVVKIASHASREAWLIWMVEKATTEFHVGTSNHSELEWVKHYFLEFDMKIWDKKLFTSFLASAVSVWKLSPARHPGHTSKGSWQSSRSLTNPLIKRNTSAGESAYRRGKALLAESTNCRGKP